jgi:hypothetical protein
LNNITIPVAGSVEEGAPPPAPEAPMEDYAVPEIALLEMDSSDSVLGDASSVKGAVASTASASSSHIANASDAALSDWIAESLASVDVDEESSDSVDDFFSALGKKKVRS